MFLQIYQSNYKVSVHKMNLMLFTFILAVHALGLIMLLFSGGGEAKATPWRSVGIPNRSGIASTVIVILRAIVDIVSILVLRGRPFKKYLKLY